MTRSFTCGKAVLLVYGLKLVFENVKKKETNNEIKNKERKHER